MTATEHETESDTDGAIFEIYSPYDKLSLIGRYWPVIKGKARAIVLIIHGFGEHCGRYRHMAQFYTTHQIACVSFDLRGHGLSGGERGFIPKLDALFDDIEGIISFIRTGLHPDIPIVIYSHGTGSLFCLAQLIQRPGKPFNCDVMIINSPSLCLNSRPLFLLLFFSRIFANLSPHYRLPINGNYTNLYTNDQEVIRNYRIDPLVHDRWPAVTTAMMLEIGTLLERTDLRIHCPTLIQHGELDTVTPFAGVCEWVEDRVQGDVTFKPWPEHFHELHNDLGKEEIFAYSLEWIETELNI